MNLFRRRSERPMNCMQVGHRLQRYLDGDIDDLTARFIMLHLEDCRRRGLEASAYTEIKASLARRAIDVPDDAVTRLRAFGERLVHDGLPADRDLPDETPGA